MEPLMMSILAYIQAHFTDLIESFTVTIAAITVILGVNAWKREHVGRRRIELAEDVLTAFYEASDVIRYIRSPLSYSGEGSSRKVAKEETPEEKKIYDSAYVVIERYEQEKDVFNKIRSLRYRFMTLFGKDKATPFSDLHKIISEILASTRRLAHLWLQQQKEQSFVDPKKREELRKQIEKYESIFWEMPKDEDPLLPRLDEIIEKIETHCSAIIGQQRTTVRIINTIGTLFRCIGAKIKQLF